MYARSLSLLVYECVADHLWDLGDADSSTFLHRRQQRLQISLLCSSFCIRATTRRTSTSRSRNRNPSLIPLVAPQKAVGIGWTNTLSAALCWVGFGLILLTMRYGEEMREMGARWEGLEEPESRSGTTDSKATLVSSSAVGETELESQKPVGK